MKKTREEQDIHDLDELFERYRQAPDSYVFVPLADACRKLGRIEEALEICEHGLRRHPSYPSGHVVKGKCSYDRGDRAAARTAFERVLVLDEDNLVALKYMGMIEADEGRLDAAERHLQRILSLDPENKEIKTILHLVEEQEQIERTDETPTSGDEMDVIDEILGDVPPAASEEPAGVDEPGSENPSEPNAAVVASETKAANDDIETSDELASVTLADIFASQGYTSKAEKIYRELLRKQPANAVVRTRLRELAGESALPAVEAEDAASSDVRSAAADDSRIDAESRDEPVSPDQAPEDEPAVGVTPAAADPGDEQPVLSAARPAIDEKDNLGHFKRWLTKLQK